MTMQKIDRIREKIGALLQKNKDNGASEAEANAAMSYAAKLMSEYGVTLDDIRSQNEASIDFVKKCMNEGEKNLSVFDRLVSPAIARYTDTKAWNDKTVRRTSRLTFFGYRVDVELAEYILEVCKRASDTEWKKFSAKLPVGARHKARKSFLSGMAVRLSERLRELKTENVQKNDGRQLVVVKTEMVARAFSDMDMKLRSGGTIRYSANGAFQAGKDAANTVRFNRAVSDGPSGGVRMIGNG
jgi:hypothetical protein